MKKKKKTPLFEKLVQIENFVEKFLSLSLSFSQVESLTPSFSSTDFHLKMVAPLEAGDEIFTLTKLFNRLDSKSIPNHLLPSIWETLQQQFDNHTALVAYLRAYTTIDLPKGSGSSVSSVQKIVNEKVQHVYAGKSSFIKSKFSFFL